MVKKWLITIPALSGKKERRAYIWLPEHYDRLPQKRFPVLYMFDGHNVFFDSDATYGKSWGMAEFLTWTRKDLIVVAVECNHEGNRRLCEYSPFSFENMLGRIRGQGRIYMDWLVGTLKPYIDAHYRTLPDRAHTSICGSSMGGLMSLYAAACYNRVFSKAACLSPSLWVQPEKLLNLLAKSEIEPDTVIYMDYGECEMANHEDNARALMSAATLLLKKRVNLTFRIVPGGIHSESCWEQQIPIFMDCLGL